MNKLITPAPHIHSGDSVTKRMGYVILALLPAWGISIWQFGLGALAVTLISIASCVLFEFLIQRFLLKRPNSTGDLSAVVTGLLLAFNLPSNLPFWIVIIGALVAIGIGKMSFGGIGSNPFNPALVGRVFLLISFPAQMTSWPLAGQGFAHYMDAETGATPLAQLASQGLSPDLMDLLIGRIGGSLGEVSAIALLVGGLFLLATGTIRYYIPVSIMATVALFTGILHACGIGADPLTHLLTGGLLLGALFMATDYATSPMTKLGQVIYGIGIGIITVLIREFGIYPEGMSFAILLMTAVTPLLNHLTPTRFGGN